MVVNGSSYIPMVVNGSSIVVNKKCPISWLEGGGRVPVGATTDRVDTPFVATLPLVATFTDKHSVNKEKSR